MRSSDVVDGAFAGVRRAQRATRGMRERCGAREAATATAMGDRRAAMSGAWDPKLDELQCATRDDDGATTTTTARDARTRA